MVPDSESSPRWLDWARSLQALAQTGLTFAHDPFDIERYEQIRRMAAEMFAWSSDGVKMPTILGLFEAQSGYTTPKVDVRGVVFNLEGRLLLVRERADGMWTLPGGWADVGSSPGENVVREIREEAGFETRATKILAVYDRDKHGHPSLEWHVYKLFIRCEIVGGVAADDGTPETAGARFFARDEVPEELSTTRTTAAQIGRMFEHFQQPGIPTDFD